MADQPRSSERPKVERSLAKRLGEYQAAEGFSPGTLTALARLDIDRARRNATAMPREEARRALIAAETGKPVTKPKEHKGASGLLQRFIGDIGDIGRAIPHMPLALVKEVTTEVPKIFEHLRDAGGEIAEGDIGSALHAAATAPIVRMLPGAYLAENLGASLTSDEDVFGSMGELWEHPGFALLDLTPYGKKVPAVQKVTQPIKNRVADGVKRGIEFGAERATGIPMPAEQVIANTFGGGRMAQAANRMLNQRSREAFREAQKEIKEYVEPIFKKHNLDKSQRRTLFEWMEDPTPLFENPEKFSNNLIDAYGDALQEAMRRAEMRVERGLDTKVYDPYTGQEHQFRSDDPKVQEAEVAQRMYEKKVEQESDLLAARDKEERLTRSLHKKVIEPTAVAVADLYDNVNRLLQLTAQSRQLTTQRRLMRDAGLHAATPEGAAWLDNGGAARLAQAAAAMRELRLAHTVKHGSPKASKEARRELGLSGGGEVSDVPLEAHYDKTFLDTLDELDTNPEGVMALLLEEAIDTPFGAMMMNAAESGKWALFDPLATAFDAVARSERTPQFSSAPWPKPDGAEPTPATTPDGKKKPPETRVSDQRLWDESTTAGIELGKFATEGLGDLRRLNSMLFRLRGLVDLGFFSPEESAAVVRLLATAHEKGILSQNASARVRRAFAQSETGKALLGEAYRGLESARARWLETRQTHKGHGSLTATLKSLASKKQYGMQKRRPVKTRGKVGTARKVKASIESFAKLLEDPPVPTKPTERGTMLGEAAIRVEKALTEALDKGLIQPEQFAEWMSIRKALQDWIPERYELGKVTPDKIPDVMAEVRELRERLDTAYEKLPIPETLKPIADRVMRDRVLEHLRSKEKFNKTMADDFADLDVSSLPPDAPPEITALIAAGVDPNTSVGKLISDAGEQIARDIELVTEGIYTKGVSPETADLIRDMMRGVESDWRSLWAWGLGIDPVHAPRFDIERAVNLFKTSGRLHGATLRETISGRKRSLLLEPAIKDLAAAFTLETIDRIKRDNTEFAISQLIRDYGLYDGGPNLVGDEPLPEAMQGWLELAKRRAPEGTDPAAVARQMMAAQYVEWDPFEMVPWARPRTGKENVVELRHRPVGGDDVLTLSFENVMVPKWVKDLIEQTYKNEPKTAGGALWDKSMKFWRGSILAASPRWHINNVVSGAILLGAEMRFRDIPTLFRRFDDIREMARSGGENMPIGIAQGMVSMPREVAAVDFLQSLSLGRMAGNYMRARGVADSLGGWIEKAYDANGFVDNMIRSIRYVQEETTALKQGKTASAAEMAGVEAANKVLQDWDAMMPFEKAIIRNIFPFYGWLKHIVQFSWRYPSDHPVRVAFMSNLTRHIEHEFGSGFPDFQKEFFSFGSIFGRGDSDSDEAFGIYVGGMNPFSDLDTTLSIAGLLIGGEWADTGAVTGQLNPGLAAILESLGFDTLSGSPELFPDLEVDPVTGKLRARPRGIMGAFLEQMSPQVGALRKLSVAHTGRDPLGMIPGVETADLVLLHRENPTAFWNRFVSMTGLTPVVPRTINPKEQAAKAEISRYRAQTQAWSRALRTGDFSHANRYPGNRVLYQKLKELERTNPEYVEAMRPIDAEAYESAFLDALGR